MKTVKLALPLTVLTLILCIGHSRAADPQLLERLGFSPERFQRITRHIDERVKADKEAGIQLVIARHNEVAVVHNTGLLHGDTPIPDDAIFHVHSMMKPITSLAILLLLEEGKLLLSDPISAFIPEYADMRVYVSGEGDSMVTQPAKNPITVLHLLTHTAGYTYNYEMRNAPVMDWYSRHVDYGSDLETVARQLSRAPLTHEPGTAWEYGASTTILGRLVEVISGEKFSDFIQRRIFDPLDMKDSGFMVERDQLHRLAARYYRGEDGKLEESDFDRTRSTIMPSYTPGDGGLYSTARDYLRFCQMIMNGGELDGVRVAAPKTIQLMTTDFVPPSVPKPIMPPGKGFTPGFSIYADHGETQSMVSEGSVNWGGASGAIFWIDFKEELIVIMLTQSYPPHAPRSQIRLESLVYQAILR